MNREKYASLIGAVSRLLAVVLLAGCWAVGSLQAATPEDGEAGALVHRMSETESWAEFRLISGQLVKLGAPSAPLLIELLSEDGPIGWRAADILVRIGKPSISYLIEALESENAQVRNRTAGVLQRIGPDAADAVGILGEYLLQERRGLDSYTVVSALSGIGEPGIPVLVEALEHPELDVRQRAIKGLGWIGPAAYPAVPRLKEMLFEHGWEREPWEIPNLQMRIARTLSSIVTEREELFPYLAEALDHQDPVRRAGVLRVLMAHGAREPALASVVRSLALEDLDEAVRHLALQALPTIAPGMETAAFLIEFYRDAPTEPLAIKALSVLNMMPAEVARLVPAFSEAIRARTSDLQNVYPLLNLETDLTPVVTVLMEKFEDSRAQSRILWQLSLLGADPETIVPLIVERLEFGGMDRELVSAVHEIGPAAAPAVPVLARIVEVELKSLDPDGNFIRSLGPTNLGHLASALGAIGPGATAALPQLEEIFHSIDPTGGREALLALGKVGMAPERFLPLVERALQKEDEEMRRRLEAAGASRLLMLWHERELQTLFRPLRALTESGITTPESHRLLIKVVGNPERRGVVAAIEALGRWRVEEARPALEPLADNLQTDVRLAAAVALHRIDPEHSSALSLILEELHHDTLGRRLAAMRSLAQVGPDAGVALPLLIEALGDSDDGVRSQAAQTLGSMGAAAEPAIPALQRALEDRQKRVGENVAKALEAIVAAANPPQ